MAAGFIATKHGRRIAVGVDVVVGDVDLEGRHAGQRSGRSADLGGELGEGCQVVAEQRTGGGEPVTGQLHAVARVAGEPDDDPVDLSDLRRAIVCAGHHAPLPANDSGDGHGQP